MVIISRIGQFLGKVISVVLILAGLFLLLGSGRDAFELYLHGSRTTEELGVWDINEGDMIEANINCVYMVFERAEAPTQFHGVPVGKTIQKVMGLFMKNKDEEKNYYYHVFIFTQRPNAFGDTTMDAVVHAADEETREKLDDIYMKTRVYEQRYSDFLENYRNGKTVEQPKIDWEPLRLETKAVEMDTELRDQIYDYLGSTTREDKMITDEKLLGPLLECRSYKTVKAQAWAGLALVMVPIIITLIGRERTQRYKSNREKYEADGPSMKKLMKEYGSAPEPSDKKGGVKKGHMKRYSDKAYEKEGSAAAEMEEAVMPEAGLEKKPEKKNGKGNKGDKK
ncbi:MAG: hypothetical protein IJ806_05980 [Ruminococcus sp.]|nr:hypothetical protein [Ruminococcus sp.]